MFIPFAHFAQLATTPATPGLTALNYGRFVATRSNGVNNRAQWSNDGITWNLATTPNGAWGSINFSPQLGLYVAGLRSSFIDNLITSTNGVTWTTRSIGETTAVGAITWCESWNKFLAVTTNYLYESTDAVNWNICFTMSGDVTIKKGVFVTYSGATVSSVSGQPLFATWITNNIIVYSTDGIEFKTYSISNYPVASPSYLSYTKYGYSDVFFATQRTGGIITLTYSIYATGSTPWRRDSITTGNVNTAGGSSINSTLGTSSVVFANWSTTTTTLPIRYSTGLNPLATNSFISVTLPSTTYQFSDVYYSRALSRWIAVRNENITSGAIYTSDASPTAAPTTWTSRTAAGGTIETVTFGDGVRTNAYRQGAHIT